MNVYVTILLLSNECSNSNKIFYVHKDLKTNKQCDNSGTQLGGMVVEILVTARY